MAHLFRPSAQQDVGLVVPTDRRPNSPQAPWQAHAAQPRLLKIKLTLSPSSCCSAATLPPKRKGEGEGESVDPPDQETRLMLRTSRRASKTVTHFAVNPHLGQWVVGRGLSFVTSKRTVLKRRRDSTEEKTGWDIGRDFWGNCQSKRKKPRRDPKTSRCNFIYTGLIEQEPQPRLCRQARICVRIDTPQSFSSVTSLPKQANNVGCWSPKEIPPLFATRRWKVSSPAAWCP